MASDNMDQPEKILWEEYLSKCNREGKEPTPTDFAEWAKKIMNL